MVFEFIFIPLTFDTIISATLSSSYDIGLYSINYLYLSLLQHVTVDTVIMSFKLTVLVVNNE